MSCVFPCVFLQVFTFSFLFFFSEHKCFDVCRVVCGRVLGREGVRARLFFVWCRYWPNAAVVYSTICQREFPEETYPLEWSAPLLRDFSLSATEKGTANFFPFLNKKIQKKVQRNDRQLQQ